MMRSQRKDSRRKKKSKRELREEWYSLKIHDMIDDQ